MASRLGELLVRENLISLQQLQKAQEEQRKTGGRLGVQLTKLGFIEETDLTSFLSKQYGVPSINLAEFEIDPEISKLVPKEVAEKHLVIPVNRAGSSLIVAMSDPSNIYAIDDLKFVTGYNIEVVVAGEAAIKLAIDKAYDTGISYKEVMEGFDDAEIELGKLEEDVNVLDLEKSAEDAPVVKLVNLILVDAIKRGASDIHIEPYEKNYRIRFRIDGILMEVMRPNLKLKDPLTSRVKILAKLNIAERRLPQDGRIKLRVNMGGKQKVIDYRVSILPTLFGEKIVLRLLDSDKLMLDLTKLGFEQESLDRWDRQISKPYGMVLVTGPTGSGKTNTLYSSIAKLNTVDTNIITAEDPVEFNFPGINQVQMKEQIGLNFAAALRSFLRQDPNIILVGEIRDFETAEIAIKASLTGHLVLSTLHTNDAPSTINRLMNMGVEPFLVATSVNIICAQRLVRRLCTNCKTVDSHHQPEEALYLVGFTPEEVQRSITLYKPVGCEVCNNRGYKGRVGLYEVLEMSETLKDMILTGASAIELREQAQKEGMLTLRRSGCRKVLDGVTTIEEIIRETVL